jgi:hypothetical protein
LVQSTTNLRTGWSNNIDVTASIIDSPNQTNPVIPLFPSYLRREFSVPQNGNSFYRVQATILP